MTICKTALLVSAIAALAWIQPKSPAPAVQPAPPQTAQPSPLAASIARGKMLYQQQCLACHQVDGSGVMNMNPPLSGTTYVLGEKTALIRIVMEGMKTPLTIGDYDYHNVMPPHTTLTDPQIADVLTYIRHSFGNKATAITAVEVKAVRVKVASSKRPPGEGGVK